MQTNENYLAFNLSIVHSNKLSISQWGINTKLDLTIIKCRAITLKKKYPWNKSYMSFTGHYTSSMEYSKIITVTHLPKAGVISWVDSISLMRVSMFALAWPHSILYQELYDEKFYFKGIHYH